MAFQTGCLTNAQKPQPHPLVRQPSQGCPPRFSRFSRLKYAWAQKRAHCLTSSPITSLDHQHSLWLRSHCISTNISDPGDCRKMPATRRKCLVASSSKGRSKKLSAEENKAFQKEGLKYTAAAADATVSGGLRDLNQVNYVDVASWTSLQCRSFLQEHWGAQ